MTSRNQAPPPPHRQLTSGGEGASLSEVESRSTAEPPRTTTAHSPESGGDGKRLAKQLRRYVLQGLTVPDFAPLELSGGPVLSGSLSARNLAHELLRTAGELETALSRGALDWVLTHLCNPVNAERFMATVTGGGSGHGERQDLLILLSRAAAPEVAPTNQAGELEVYRAVLRRGVAAAHEALESLDLAFPPMPSTRRSWEQLPQLGEVLGTTPTDRLTLALLRSHRGPDLQRAISWLVAWKVKTSADAEDWCAGALAWWSLRLLAISTAYANFRKEKPDPMREVALQEMLHSLSDPFSTVSARETGPREVEDGWWRAAKAEVLRILGERDGEDPVLRTSLERLDGELRYCRATLNNRIKKLRQADAAQRNSEQPLERTDEFGEAVAEGSAIADPTLGPTISQDPTAELALDDAEEVSLIRRDAVESDGSLLQRALGNFDFIMATRGGAFSSAVRWLNANYPPPGGANNLDERNRLAYSILSTVDPSQLSWWTLEGAEGRTPDALQRGRNRLLSDFTEQFRQAYQLGTAEGADQ